MLGLYLAGFVARIDHRAAAEELDSQVQRYAVHSGAAAVPHADAVVAGAAADGSRAHLSCGSAGTIIVCVTLALWVLAHLPVMHTASGALTAPAAGRQRDRTAGPLHRAGDCAAGLQLEDRHRPAVERAGARGDGEHDGHALRRRPEHAGAATCRPRCTTT